ncbi:hypothetical protein [Actinokineospora sp. UTMC 2448]|uniref:hypothetical protein n=1 Tax=Actinokineospora sp. UTMC 2448 TaxID=2268449 RepID=UPI002164E21E|nr:hypothetical protein [Actinokineospora sp. UTMC 2448]UVS79310.1 hypothetical protein Actkin_03057 [Actinokineospora sp. UTMC 2448]
MTRLSALVAALVATASTVVWAPSAAAAACSGTAGVTVVVDFGSLGGGTRVACAPGDPSSGMGALSGAGFGYTGVSSHPGMVCKINGQPAAEACRRPPPTTAYWSYWYATRGGSWTYSSTGAGYRDPAPGTVEGWAFGAGSPPGTPPPAPAPAPKPPPPAPEPTATTRPGAPAKPAPSGQQRTTTPQATTIQTTSAATTTASGQPTTSATTTGQPAGDPTTSGPVSAEVAPSAAEREDGGAPTSFLIGAAAVVLIGGLAIGAARRRAKADP